MTNTKKYAKQELEILASLVPDSVVTPFTKQILSLCEAFGKSGQSGGSAPYTATALSETIKKLLLFKPLTELKGLDDEWIDVGDGISQNKRCFGVFKDPDGRTSYSEAIIWRGEEEWDVFTGRVYVMDKPFTLIGSTQYMTFPFKPKSFYVDVIKIPITEEKAEEKDLFYVKQDDECYYYKVKDGKQLESVFEYYQGV